MSRPTFDGEGSSRSKGKEVVNEEISNLPVPEQKNTIPPFVKQTLDHLQQQIDVYSEKSMPLALQVQEIEKRINSRRMLKLQHKKNYESKIKELNDLNEHDVFKRDQILREYRRLQALTQDKIDCIDSIQREYRNE